MKGLTAEAASRADLEALLEIEERSYSHPWTRRNFEGELAAGVLGLFVVLREPAAVAAADRGLRAYCAFQVVAGEMHLMNLTVSPERRGQGLGRFLLGLVLDLAARRGAREAFLEVRESNAPARALYRRAGFREAGYRRGYYQKPAEDAVVLRLPLPDRGATRNDP